MAFVIELRDRAGTVDTRRRLADAHWAYMDGFDSAVIARGPILGDDGTPVASLRVVDLPDSDAVRAFLDDEPYVKAGIYEDIRVTRWTNALDRRVADLALNPDWQRFVFVGSRPESENVTDKRDALLQAHRDYLNAPGRAEHVLLRGPLRDETGEVWLGSFFLLDVPDRAGAEALFADEPFNRAGLYEGLEFRPWRPGGAPI